MLKKVLIALSLLMMVVVYGCTAGQPHAQNIQGQKLAGDVGTNRGDLAPDFTITTIDGKTMSLSSLAADKPTVLYFFATWCPSCIKAAEVLEQNNDKLNGMKVISLKTFGNAGYGGPTIIEFGQKYSPNALNYDNWIWGDASQKATSIYNSQNYPDIYFLIDENGVLQAVDGAPAATLNKIITFAQR